VLVNYELFQGTEEQFSSEFVTGEMRLNSESLKAMEKLEDKAAKMVKLLYDKGHLQAQWNLFPVRVKQLDLLPWERSKMYLAFPQRMIIAPLLALSLNKMTLVK